MKKRDRKNAGNFLHDNFLKSIDDLKKMKLYFRFSFAIFFGVAFFGFLFPIFFVDRIIEIIQILATKTQNMNAIELIRFIMTNNITSAFIGVASGLLLGVFPITVIIVNSYILGFVINKSVLAEGFFIIWRLFPHGIFEIPAILISVSLGLRLGFLLMHNCIHMYSDKKSLTNFRIAILMLLSIIFLPFSFLVYLVLTFTNKKLKKELYENIWMSLRMFILIVVPLLVIAGIVEGLLIYFLS